MQFLLIHGYGVGAQYLSFHQAEGVNAGFGAFDKLIAEGRVGVFRWDIPRYFGYKTVFNPLSHLELYNKERAKAQSIEIHAKLTKTLQETSPENIVCHSMGCHLLMSYLKLNTLPPSVKNIILIQADIPNNTPLSETVESLIKAKKLKIINLYCPWDQALLTTLPLHFKLKAGLTGYKNPQVQNIFFPLYKRTNLHTSSINDPDLVKLVKELSAAS
jgi:hypothetical protein